MGTRQAIHTDQAPKAIGPYSQAVRVGDTVYLAGQIPLDPATMQMVEGDFEAEDQTGQYQRILNRIIDSHPDRFTSVFNSNDGRSRIFRVKNPE